MMEHQKVEQPLQLIDYKGRGAAQIVRLLLQYLGVPYKESFLEIPAKVNSKLLFNATYFYPEIKDGEITVQGAVPVSKYICRKYGHEDLLGKTQYDAAKIEELLIRKQQLKNSVIMEIVPRRDLFVPQKRSQLLKLAFDQPTRKQLMIQLEALASNKGGAFGYISLLDFFMYEISYNIVNVFPETRDMYPNYAVKYRQKFQQLQQIKNYLASGRVTNNSQGVFSKVGQQINSTKSKLN